MAVCLLFPAWLHAQAEPYYQPHFPPEDFKARWKTIFDRIGDRGVAILQGMPKVNGFIFPRQTNEFYYLCGIETPHSYLVLDGRTKKATLYMPARNRQLESAEGKVLSADDAVDVKRLVGVDQVLSNAEMKGEWLGSPSTIYTLLTPAEGNSQARGEIRSANDAIAQDPWDGRPSREQNFANLLKERFSKAQIKDITPVLDEMRSIKSAREIAVIRRA